MKEIIYPLGAQIDVRAVRLGDETMSVLEIWGAEYQENDCLLIRPGDRGLLERICARERAIMQARLGRPPHAHRAFCCCTGTLVEMLTSCSSRSGGLMFRRCGRMDRGAQTCAASAA